MYRSFTECLFLKEKNRLDENDPHSVEFVRILNNIRDGKISEEDGTIIRKTCSRFGMGEKEFQKWDSKKMV